MKKDIETPNRITRLLIGLLALICIVLVFVYIQNTSQIPEIKTDNPEVETVPKEEVIVPKTYTYIEVVSSCGASFEGVCAKAYAKPDIKSKVRDSLRNGSVYRVEGKVADANGAIWYKVKFEKVRYPQRIAGDWYISNDSVREFEDIGEEVILAGVKIENNQRIVVDLSEQKLQAFEGDDLVMEMIVSTGLAKSPTPIGNFTIFMKRPSRYMQSDPGSSDYYDLPGVPWDMYFDKYGDVIHGAYWHNSFGHRHSHGCVNLQPDDARTIYMWAKLGARVIVQK